MSNTRHPHPTHYEPDEFTLPNDEIIAVGDELELTEINYDGIDGYEGEEVFDVEVVKIVAYDDCNRGMITFTTSEWDSQFTATDVASMLEGGMVEFVHDDGDVTAYEISF